MSNSETNHVEAFQPKNLVGYWITAGGLGLLSVILGFASFPIPLIAPLTILVTCLFLALPMLAMFYAGRASWTPTKSLLCILGGVTLQALSFYLIDQKIATGPIGAVCSGLTTFGLLTWCLGLGALVACLVKEKNILLPIAIALAGVDIFLVLTPVGPTQAIIKANPKVLESVALQVPKVQAEPTSGPVVPALLVGPADLIFVAMFFVAIFRYGMRGKETLFALIPVLIIYMGLVATFGMPLPAMVPIAITILLVNICKFDLSRDEWIMTGFIALLFGALIAWGLTRKPPVAPLKNSPALNDQRQELKPEQALPGQSP